MYFSELQNFNSLPLPPSPDTLISIPHTDSSISRSALLLWCKPHRRRPGEEGSLKQVHTAGLLPPSCPALWPHQSLSRNPALSGSSILILFLLSFIFWDFIFILCVYVLTACVPQHHVHAVPMKARRGHQILWNWSYRVLSCHVGAGIELRPSRIAAR